METKERFEKLNINELEIISQEITESLIDLLLVSDSVSDKDEVEVQKDFDILNKELKKRIEEIKNINKNLEYMIKNNKIFKK